MDTEPKAGTPETEESTESVSPIEYYPAEGDIEGSEEVAPAEGAGAALPATPLVQAPGQVPTGNVPPVPGTPAPTPPTAPGPLPYDVTQYQQALAAQQRLQEQQAAEVAQLRLQAELGQLRNQWANEGFDESQIQRGLAQHRQLAEQQYALTAREQAFQREQQSAQGVLQYQAQLILAHRLSASSGMPVEELMKLGDYPLMRAEAKAFALEAQLAKAQKARVKPTQLASVGPGNKGAQSITQLKQYYADGGNLTPAQKEAIGLY